RLLETSPSPSVDQSHSGGILDPIEGTVTLALIGTIIATPIAVSTAVWVVEYGRPRWLARIVESSIELIAGTPDVVIAIFGLALFQIGILAPFSFRSSSGGVYGRSFLAASHSAPSPRSLLRDWQDANSDDPTRPAPGTAIRHRDRSDARPRPDHRQHCDRRRAAGRDPAEQPREWRSAIGVPARHRLDAAELHPQQLTGRRGERGAEGLRRGVRADADHPRAELAGRADLACGRRQRPLFRASGPMSVCERAKDSRRALAPATGMVENATMSINPIVFDPPAPVLAPPVTSTS